MNKVLSFSLVFFLALAPAVSSQADIISSGETERSQVQWKKFFQQVFTWNLKAQLTAEGLSDKEIETRYEKSTYYTDRDFYQVYSQVTEAPTTLKAIQVREKLLSQRDSFLKAQNLKSTGKLKWKRSAASSLAQGLTKKSQTKQAAADYKQGLNYFDTEFGGEVFEILSDTVMVIVPGFGSHTMKDFSYSELVESANAYYGRPLARPREEIQGTDQVKYEDPVEYYSRNNKPLGFDVVHPMGYELGNSMGYNSDVAEQLAKWINSLPKAYADKKLIFVGYSKGTPIAHHLIQEHEDIRKRTKAIFTVAGVVQGALPAQSGLNMLMEATGANDQDELIQKVKEGSETFMKAAAPYLSQAAGFALSLAESPGVKKILGSLGVDVGGMIGDLQNFLHTQQILEVFKGVYDMTPYTRVKWAMDHLNNKSLDQEDLTIFNLSVLTNVQDFLAPGGYDEFGPIASPQVVPQFTAKGLDWTNFSLDNVFLHATSLGAFEESPGGMFDTQVAWLDTKSFVLDDRPLSESLNQRELDQLSNELGQAIDPSRPRKQLIPTSDLQGLNFVDLGEIRGSHWDISFGQVYKPPKNVKKYYEHLFPRQAYYRSILETYAVYVQLGKGGN